MSTLYTKNGRPLQASGSNVYSRSGAYLGRISGAKIFDPRGRYAATIVVNCAVYRTMDRGTVSGPSASSGHTGSTAAHTVRSAIWGDEPNFPD
jgi:hypothetical protein